MLSYKIELFKRMQSLDLHNPIYPHAAMHMRASTNDPLLITALFTISATTLYASVQEFIITKQILLAKNIPLV